MPPLDPTRIASASAIGGAAVLMAFLLLSPAPAPLAPPVAPQAPVPALVPID
jgi:hypothetical protein